MVDLDDRAVAYKSDAAFTAEGFLKLELTPGVHATPESPKLTLRLR